MDIKSRVPGRVIKFGKKVSDTVKKGDIVAIMEAMKMEQPMPAPCDGIITAINVEINERVSPGTIIMTIE